jgi:hypothetical protein
MSSRHAGLPIINDRMGAGIRRAASLLRALAGQPGRNGRTSVRFSTMSVADLSKRAEELRDEGAQGT